MSNLAIGYTHKNEKITIFKGLNLTVKEGELVSIVGSNGVGKSTLLRTLGGLQHKIEGSICIANSEITTYRPSSLATHLSMVLTEPIAAKNLTVLELISLGRQPYTNWIGKLRKEDKTIINQSIEQVDIEDLKLKKCYELSDGQLQKVMLARALAQNTPIILLDEPTTHLDLYHKAQIIKLLKQVAHETNKTIVYTTHEIELGIQLCDKMLIMQKDKYTFNSPKELIANCSFDSLFPSDTIKFDATTKAFKIKH